MAQALRVDKRLALIVLWLVFAAAAVGVGFGAAGLIGGPFTGASASINDVRGSVAPTVFRETPTASVAVPSPVSSPSPNRPRTKRASPPGRISNPTPQRQAPKTVASNRVTSGGSVYARCSGGLVSISASPAVGWVVDDIDSGRNTRSRLDFEHSENDARVEVEVHCARGRPAFAVRERGPDGDDVEESDD